MSTTEAPYSFTPKVLGNLFTIRGDSFQSFIENLQNAHHVPEVEEFLKVITGENKLAQVFEVPAETPTAPSQTFAPVAPPVTQAAPVTPTGPVCKHGAMNHRTGTNKNNGAPWSGYFCPSPKGTPDQCPPQFGK